MGSTEIFSNAKTKLRDPAWFAALGLLSASKSHGNFSSGTLASIWRDLKTAIKLGLKQLMP